MRFSRLSLVLAAASIGIAAFAAPGHKHRSNLVREWQARYNVGAKMFTAKDTNGLAAGLTDNWEMTGPNGSVMAHKADMDKFKAQLDAMQDFRAKFHVMRVKQEGDNAVVRARFDFTGKMKGPDGKMHRVRNAGVNDETWIKEGDMWKMSKMHTVDEKYTMDGKLTRPPGM